MSPMTPKGGGASSGLSAEQLSLLRVRLEHERDGLRERLQREQAAALQAESFAEPMDAAEQTREQDDGVTFTERDRALLRDVEAALAKLDAGTYGLSEISGQPIGFPRLKAVPWAKITADEAEAG
jgi:DnaK suppressor protein